MKILAVFLVCLFSASYAAVAPSTSRNSFSEDDKAKLIQDLEDEELSKEVENLIANLDEDQLAKLEDILSKDLDAESELSMIQDELEEMGMDPEDINDLLDLAAMMTKFLSKVPELDLGEDEDDYSLEDHVKLYLLGLPNRLGPLGFLALHSVLQTDEDIVDVKIEGFEPNPEAAEAANTASVTPLGDIITRKRRESQKKGAQVPHNAAKAPSRGPKIPDNAHQVPPKHSFAAGGEAAYSGDIVSDIIKRRKRAIH